VLNSISCFPPLGKENAEAAAFWESWEKVWEAAKNLYKNAAFFKKLSFTVWTFFKIGCRMKRSM
jgi:hypothetical protein